jgi:hypothetical protein
MRRPNALRPLRPPRNPLRSGLRVTPRTCVQLPASRTSLRARSAADLVHAVLRRLSPRDWEIVHLLHQHRVLTTQHVCDALFPSRRTAEMRLLDLYQLRVVDRFRPFTRSGSGAVPLDPGRGRCPPHRLGARRRLEAARLAP